MLTVLTARKCSSASALQPRPDEAGESPEGLLTPDILRQGLLSCRMRGFVQVRLPDYVVVCMSYQMLQYFEHCPFKGPVGQPLFHFIHPCDAPYIAACAEELGEQRQTGADKGREEEKVMEKDIAHACVRMFTFGSSGIRCLPFAVSFDRSCYQNCSSCVLEFEPLEEGRGDCVVGGSRPFQEVGGVFAFDELRSHDGGRHGARAACVEVEDAVYGAGGEMKSLEALDLARQLSSCFGVNEKKLLVRMLQLTLSIVRGEKFPKWNFLRFRLSLPCILGQLKTEWQRGRHSEQVEMNGRDSSSPSSSCSSKVVFLVHESDGSASLCFSEFTLDERREQGSLHGSRLYRVSKEELYCCGIDQRRRSSQRLPVYEHWWNVVEGET